MAIVNIYLTFNGNCEEAFNLYKSVFGGEFRFVGRFKDMPPQEGQPAIPAEHGNRIMHITLPISKETLIFGSDTGGEWAADYKEGNNFTISITAGSREEAERIFNGLSKDGQVTMPLGKTFWSECFGMLKDKFGINWMMSYDSNQPSQ
jgi:PhnB protein